MTPPNSDSAVKAAESIVAAYDWCRKSGHIAGHASSGPGVNKITTIIEEETRVTEKEEALRLFIKDVERARSELPCGDCGQPVPHRTLTLKRETIVKAKDALADKPETPRGGNR